MSEPSTTDSTSQSGRLQQVRDLVASLSVTESDEARRKAVLDFGRGLPGTTTWAELRELRRVFDQSLTEQFPASPSSNRSNGATQLGRLLEEILVYVHKQSLRQRQQLVRAFVHTVLRTTPTSDRNHAISVFAKSIQTAEHEDHEDILLTFEKLVNAWSEPRDEIEMVGIMRWDLWHEQSALHVYFNSSGVLDFVRSLHVDMSTTTLEVQVTGFAANFAASRVTIPLCREDYEILTDQLQHSLREIFNPDCVGWMVEIMLNALPDLSSEDLQEMLERRRESRFEAFMYRLRDAVNPAERDLMIRE